jgi:hypothetical protein
VRVIPAGSIREIHVCQWQLLQEGGGVPGSGEFARRVVLSVEDVSDCLSSGLATIPGSHDSRSSLANGTETHGTACIQLGMSECRAAAEVNTLCQRLLYEPLA